MDRTGLERKPLAELREIAAALELRGYQRMRKADLIDLIIGAERAAAGGNGESPATASAQGNGATTPTHSSGEGESAAQDRRKRADAQALIERRRADQRSDDSESEQGRTRARTRSRDDAEEQAAAEGSAPGNGKARHDQHEDGEREQADRRDAKDGGAQREGRSGDGGTQREGRPGDDDRDDSQGGRRPKRDRRRKGRGGSQQDQFEDAEVRDGVLDLLPEGYGFLRTTGYLSGSKDVYVSQSFVRRFNLRRGDLVRGPIRHNKGNDKFPALARIDDVEGVAVENENDPHLRQRINFGDLTPLFPHERLPLETPERSPMSMRIVDMVSPIGKGQRGLIVSPPKAGKTTILKQLAHAVETNNPEVHLMVLLVDERPEEVTDFERSTKGEVISSTFDRPADDHTQVAELCIERAKRLVERGRDVVILLDSITRLGRAYNLAAPTSGRILSGGIDSAALYPPKRFFGAARNIEGGGSLTIIATALVETGSKMDEVIFEEFKGTGNMELRLDRRMEQKRIFPAVDIGASSTRREELLLGKSELEIVWKLRRLLSSMDSEAALQLLIDKLRATKNNEQFLSMIARSNLG